MNQLDQIRIVMINTSDSGNLGSAARAMKTMEFSDLCLVAPLDPPSTAKAVSRASGAADVLYAARIVDNLDDALADCQLVIGASARMRTIPWPLLTPPALAQVVNDSPSDTRVALLFGREDSGLTNEELQRCHFHVTIPGNPEYCVLNVSQAIQVLCYQLRQTLIESPSTALPQDALSSAMQGWDAPLADASEVERFLAHFEAVMLDLGFFDPNNPRQLLTRVRRLFHRARMDRMEVNVLRGVLSAVQKRIRPASSTDP